MPTLCDFTPIIDSNTGINIDHDQQLKLGNGNSLVEAEFTTGGRNPNSLALLQFSMTGLSLAQNPLPVIVNGQVVGSLNNYFPGGVVSLTDAEDPERIRRQGHTHIQLVSFPSELLNNGDNTLHIPATEYPGNSTSTLHDQLTFDSIVCFFQQGTSSFWGRIWGAIGDLINRFAGWFCTVFGGTLLLLGKVIAGLQELLGIGGKRELLPLEVRLLNNVFRGSLDLDRVRIVEGKAGVASWFKNGRPFVLGNTIYMKGPTNNREAVLVHEAVHVWQYQHLGPQYICKTLAAQLYYSIASSMPGIERDAYDWESETEAVGLQWTRLNWEAQGKFFEHLYASGTLVDVYGSSLNNSKGAYFHAQPPQSFGRFVVNGKDYSAMANEAVANVRVLQ